MVAKSVPGAEYALFQATGNDLGALAFQTWQRVWDAGLARAYTTDFEVWKPSPDGRMELEIYVAVK